MATKRKWKTERSSRLRGIEVVNALREKPSCPSALRYLHKSLMDGGSSAESFAEDLVAHGFLQLIPDILRQASKNGMPKGIEVLGVFSMSSLTTHRKVVSDKDVMCAFTETFLSTDVDLLTSACQVAVDLLITPLGCQVLRESAVLQHLLSLLCRIADLSKEGHSCGVRQPLEVLPASPTLDIQPSTAESERVNTPLQCTPFCEAFEDLVTAALTATSALLGNHGIHVISRDVLRNAQCILRRHWQNLLKQDEVLLKSRVEHDVPKGTWNRQRRNLVANCIVQLAMEHGISSCGKLDLEQGLFENTDFTLNTFFDEYWERSPVLLSRQIPSCLTDFSKKFTSLAAAINNLLTGSISCPLPCADQIDTIGLFEQIKSNLGEPMIYGQDIRIVKTVMPQLDKPPSHMVRPGSVGEVHYCPNGITLNQQHSRSLGPHEVLEAIEKGYSVAMKGIELRYPDVANVADCLARQLGQPSVGVNLYLTPLGAQGLDLHFDDHCVFVCQLVGCKTWNVFPPQRVLPRLYASRTWSRKALDSTPPTHYNLQKGDILYIPRGFPHKAYSGHRPEETAETSFYPDSAFFGTNVANCEANGREEKHGTDKLGAGEELRKVAGNLVNDGYSLHLTFGVEIESPFEWAGLVHIALRLWTEKRWQHGLAVQDHSVGAKELDQRCEQFCEALLHIAINILSEKEIPLRKACMVGASTVVSMQPRSGVCQEISSSLNSSKSGSACGWKNSMDCKFCNTVSVDYYQRLLESVVKWANYDEAFSFAQKVSDHCTASCAGGLEWLRHIVNAGGEITFPEPVSLVKNMIQLNRLKQFNMEDGKATFTKMKTEFGSSLMFHDASQTFKTLWSRYRTAREKFISGMLALHDDQL